MPIPVPSVIWGRRSWGTLWDSLGSATTVPQWLERKGLRKAGLPPKVSGQQGPAWQVPCHQEEDRKPHPKHLALWLPIWALGERSKEKLRAGDPSLLPPTSP